MSAPRPAAGGIRKDLAAQAVATAMSALAEFATTLALARTLGVTAWGSVALALATTTVVFACLDQRWQDAVVRYHTMHDADANPSALRSDLRRIARSNFLTGFLAALLAAGALAVVIWVRPAESTIVMVALPCVLIVMLKNIGNATARAYLRVTNRFVLLAWITLAGALVRCAAAGTVWAVGTMGATVAVFVILAGVAVAAALLLGTAFLSAHRDGLWNVADAPNAPSNAPSNAPRRDDLRKFLRVSWLSGIGLVPLREFDTMILGLIGGPTAAGTYQVAKTFFSAADMTLGPVQLAVQPRLAAAFHRAQWAALGTMIRKVVLWGAIGGAVVVALVEFAGPWVIRNLLDERYHAAIPTLRFLIVAYPISAALLWVIPLCSAAGRPDLNAKAALSAGAIGLALIAFGACFGELGAATALVTTIALMLLWNWRLAVRSPELAPVFHAPAPSHASGSAA